jgi:hypothetical protein
MHTVKIHFGRRGGMEGRVNDAYDELMAETAASGEGEAAPAAEEEGGETTAPALRGKHLNSCPSILLLPFTLTWRLPCRGSCCH